MSPASPAAVAASLRAMGCPEVHVERVLAGRPLVPVSQNLAVAVLARGSRRRPDKLRLGSIPMPAPGCWWTNTNKALVVEAIAIGQASVEGVLQRYGDVTRKDLEGWIRSAASDALNYQRAMRRRAA